MATTKLTERDITKKMLEDAADDMSAVMKFEDAIPTGKKTVKAAIQADVIEAAGELRTEDVLKPKTVEVLTALGVELPAGEESDVDASTETVPEPDEPEGDKSGKDSDEGESPPETKRLTRVQAVGKVLRDSTDISREDLIAESDALYAESGGKGNEKEAKWAVKIMLDSLLAVNVLNEVDGKFSL